MSTSSTSPASQPSGNHISLSRLVPKEHKLYHLFNFIGENYGDSPENILKAFGSIFDFDKGLRTLFGSDKKLTFKSAVSFLRYTLPASLYGIEMGIKIKKYIKNVRHGELSEYDKKQELIKKLLDIKPDGEIHTCDVGYLSEDIIDWLLSNPKTNGYKILGYHGDPELEVLKKITDDFDVIWVSLKYGGLKLALRISRVKIASISFIKDVYFYGDSTKIQLDTLRELELLMIHDFVNAFNIRENILELKGGINAKKRAVVDEKINQFDIKPLVTEIKKVLKNGRKRGYAFVGKQGTGKSIIMRKLEEILTDQIIIKISPEELSMSSSIKRCFSLIRTIQPIVVIIEDLDAFNFKEKNERVGTFINEIDDYNNLNAVFLVTINDPDMIHRTIIDRPGRFDEIYEIKPPQTKKEAYEVMKSKYDKLITSYTDFKNIKFPVMKKFNHGILDKCLKNKFTQAELTSGIIEKIFLNNNKPESICFNDAIEEAINSFEISKKSLKTYKFNEEDYEPTKSQDVAECYPSPLLAGASNG